MLDPKDRIPQVSNSFAKLIAGGRVAVADLPCGAGAAVLSILHSIAELRRKSVVPREPLHVTIVGGEVSECSRSYAAELVDASVQSLFEQAITVEAYWKSWDACDELSTADIIDELTVRSLHCGCRYLIVANFSGFLERAGKFKEAQPQLKRIFQHYGSKEACGIWIEPQMNTVTEMNSGMFSRLTGWFTNQCSRFVRTVFSGEHHTTEAMFEHPLKPGTLHKVRLAVLRFDLTRS